MTLARRRRLPWRDDGMDYSIRDVRRDDPGDAALLADLWNASDAGWPEGLTQGTPMTAERMLERLQSDRLIVLTAEAGDQLVGYGDVRKARNRDDVAYGVVLTVRPDWHDKGCGKAIVLAILERLVELGYGQFTAQTWSGNLKAIPLYKKSGFFWKPGAAGAALQNFIPMALAMPAARPFFARHDWYRSFRRDLTVAPDDCQWHEVGVYPYRFEADGDLLEMVIDRGAEAPTAIETDDFRVACYTGSRQIVCGIQHTLTWEIVNKRGDGRPLRVELAATAPPGVELEAAESLEVAGALAIERPFVVSPDVARPRPGMPLPAVVSRLALDGVPVTLGTGLATAQPVEIGVQGVRPMPGKPEEVIVRLYNRLSAPLSGEVGFEPVPGLSFEPAAALFEVPAASWASCRFLLTSGEGARTTRVRAVCTPERNPQLPLAAPLSTRAEPVAFSAVPLDHVYAWEDEEGEAVTIETPTFWVRTRLRDGSSAVYERQSGQLVLRLGAPAAGPPFEDEREPPSVEHRLAREDGRVRLTLEIPAETFPGVIVERTLTVGAGPYLRVDHRLRNTSAVEQRPRLRCPGAVFLHRGVTVPLAGGLVHEIVEGLGDFPLSGGRDLPKTSAGYAETWVAHEEHGLVAGLVWKSCAEITGVSLRLDPPAVPPRSAAELDPLYFVVGRGDWEIVRDLWQRLWGPGDEPARPTPHPVLSAGFEPAPVLVTTAHTRAALTVRNRRLKPFDGRWQLRAAGIQAEPAEGDLAGVTPDAPASREVTLACPDLTPRVVPAAIVLDSAATLDEHAAPIVVAGDGAQAVSLQALDGGARFAVDNGRLAFTAAPGHQGALISLRLGGRELLASSFPEPRPHHWMARWLGGVEPFVVNLGDPRSVWDAAAGEPVQRRGATGAAWSGVRLTCQCRHPDLHWLAITLEYLTLGASNLVALVQRLANGSGAPQEIPVGFGVFPSMPPDRAPEIRLRYEVRRPDYWPAGSTEDHAPVERQRRPVTTSFRFGDARWVALETAGATLVLTPLMPAGEAGGWINRQTAGLYTASALRLEPGETREKLAWLAVVDEPAQARGYQALTALAELP